MWIDELRERMESLKYGSMEKAERTTVPRWSPAPMMIMFVMEDKFNSLFKY